MNPKRAAWEQMKKHMPEWTDVVREVGERMGFSAGRVITPEGKFEWRRKQ